MLTHWSYVCLALTHRYDVQPTHIFIAPSMASTCTSQALYAYIWKSIYVVVWDACDISCVRTVAYVYSYTCYFVCMHAYIYLRIYGYIVSVCIVYCVLFYTVNVWNAPDIFMLPLSYFRSNTSKVLFLIYWPYYYTLLMIGVSLVIRCCIKCTYRILLYISYMQRSVEYWHQWVMLLICIYDVGHSLVLSRRQDIMALSCFTGAQCSPISCIWIILFMSNLSAAMPLCPNRLWLWRLASPWRNGGSSLRWCFVSTLYKYPGNLVPGV